MRYEITVEAAREVLPPDNDRWEYSVMKVSYGIGLVGVIKYQPYRQPLDSFKATRYGDAFYVRRAPASRAPNKTK